MAARGSQRSFPAALCFLLCPVEICLDWTEQDSVGGLLSFRIPRETSIELGNPSKASLEIRELAQLQLHCFPLGASAFFDLQIVEG